MSSTIQRVRDAVFGREVGRALAQTGRVPSVDVFRGIAILTVVLYHAEVLPYGYLGVDVFFVVSGLLIGRILVAKWDAPTPFEAKPFFIARAFKIWPSYYTMLGVGTLVAWLLYRHDHPEYLVTAAHWPRYLFFFQNYRGSPHATFDHVWSLCVEEHFYVLLPVSMLVARKLFGAKERVLFALVAIAIALGIAGKVVGYRIGFETYAATHNRIDALAWGVLLAMLVRFRGAWVERLPRVPLLVAGIAVFAAVVGYDAVYELSITPPGQPLADVGFYHRVVLFALVPFAVFLALLGSYHLDPSAGPLRGVTAPLRFVAYYSYNWYLWHPVVGPYLTTRFGKGLLGTAVYLAVTFALGVLFTVRVEEPALVLRNRVLGKKKAAPAAEDAPTRSHA